MALLPVQDAQVGPEVLVGAGHQEVAVQGAHVQQAVGRVVHRVHIHHGAGGTGPGGDVGHGIDGTGEVAGQAHRNQARASANQRPQLLQVQRARFPVDPRPMDDQVALLGHLQPGRDVGLVVQFRNDDFVPVAQGAAHAAADQIGQAGHVGAEHDFLRGTVHEVGGQPMGFRHDFVRGDAGCELAPRVGHEATQVLLHGHDHGFRHL